MAERLRSAIESLFNVRDDTNALAPSSDERRRRRNEFTETLRIYGVPILLLLAAAAVIAAATHFLVRSLVDDIVMPLIYKGVSGLKPTQVDASELQPGTFIGGVLYAVFMVAIAVAAGRAVLAKPSGFVRERIRNCPACAMTVPGSATKCRHCGTVLPTTARRSYRAQTPGRSGPRPVLSSSRSREEDGRGESSEGGPRRGRRGGRRRGGRNRSGSQGERSDDRGDDRGSGRSDERGSGRSDDRGGERSGDRSDERSGDRGGERSGGRGDGPATGASAGSGSGSSSNATV